MEPKFDEITNKYNSPDIVVTIKSYSLKWVGHVHKLSEERMVKKKLNTKTIILNKLINICIQSILTEKYCHCYVTEECKNKDTST